MEVAKQDRRLGASDNKYKENQKEKTEHVVHLARPVRKKNHPCTKWAICIKNTSFGENSHVRHLPKGIKYEE